MDIVLVLILFFILTKVSVVLHEIGHALVYLKYTEGDIFIYIGEVPSDNFQFKVGRINFAFNNWIFRNTGGINPTNHITTRKEGLMLYIAGPLMTSIIILACIAVYMIIPRSIPSLSLLYVAMMNLYFLTFALIPMSWLGGPMKGVKNDGTRIKEFLARD